MERTNYTTDTAEAIHMPGTPNAEKRYVVNVSGGLWLITYGLYVESGWLLSKLERVVTAPARSVYGHFESLNEAVKAMAARGITPQGMAE